MTVQTKSEMLVHINNLCTDFLFLKLSSLKFIYAEKSTLWIQGNMQKK